MADVPAKRSIWQRMPPRARLVVAVFGVIGIVGFIVDMAVDNTWVSAVALSAMSGALVTSLSYRSQAQPRPGNPDTRIP